MLFIDRFEPSSKKCNYCGSLNKDLKLSDRNWICEICHIEHDRDINAAINIKKIGLEKVINTSADSAGEPGEMFVC